jgi:hypothetical protein
MAAQDDYQKGLLKLVTKPEIVDGLRVRHRVLGLGTAKADPANAQFLVQFLGDARPRPFAANAFVTQELRLGLMDEARLMGAITALGAAPEAAPTTPQKRRGYSSLVLVDEPAAKSRPSSAPAPAAPSTFRIAPYAQQLQGVEAPLPVAGQRLTERELARADAAERKRIQEEKEERDRLRAKEEARAKLAPALRKEIEEKEAAEIAKYGLGVGSYSALGAGAARRRQPLGEVGAAGESLESLAARMRAPGRVVGFTLAVSGMGLLMDMELVQSRDQREELIDFAISAQKRLRTAFERARKDWEEDKKLYEAGKGEKPGRAPKFPFVYMVAELSDGSRREIDLMEKRGSDGRLIPPTGQMRPHVPTDLVNAKLVAILNTDRMVKGDPNVTAANQLRDNLIAGGYRVAGPGGYYPSDALKRELDGISMGYILDRATPMIAGVTMDPQQLYTFRGKSKLLRSAERIGSTEQPMDRARRVARLGLPVTEEEAAQAELLLQATLGYDVTPMATETSFRRGIKLKPEEQPTGKIVRGEDGQYYVVGTSRSFGSAIRAMAFLGRLGFANAEIEDAEPAGPRPPRVGYSSLVLTEEAEEPEEGEQEFEEDEEDEDEEEIDRGEVLRFPELTREMARKYPKTLFVFGDNMKRTGLGGQAKELRGEPNAVGIPTKWSPSLEAAAYFADSDFPKVKDAIDEAFDELEEHLASGRSVIVPEAGVGTGLADLPRRAPKIFAYIVSRFDQLEG